MVHRTLTMRHSSVEPSIPAGLSSKKNDQGFSITANMLPFLVTPSSPDPPLDNFLSIELPKMTPCINGSNSTTSASMQTMDSQYPKKKIH